MSTNVSFGSSAEVGNFSELVFTYTDFEDSEFQKKYCMEFRKKYRSCEVSARSVVLRHNCSGQRSWELPRSRTPWNRIRRGCSEGEQDKPGQALARLTFGETAVETQPGWRKHEQKYLLLVREVTQQSQQPTE
jgi:hypothetical protein